MIVYINLRGGQKIGWKVPDDKAAARLLQRVADEDLGLPDQTVWVELRRDSKYNYESHLIRRDAIDVITW